MVSQKALIGVTITGAALAYYYSSNPSASVGGAAIAAGKTVAGTAVVAVCSIAAGLFGACQGGKNGVEWGKKNQRSAGGALEIPAGAVFGAIGGALLYGCTAALVSSVVVAIALSRL